MKEDKTAPEVALYLTFLAYKSGGLAAVTTARSALKYYAKLQGVEGNYRGWRRLATEKQPVTWKPVRLRPQ